MAGRNPYSEEELSIICKAVKDNPTNLRQAFNKASIIIKKECGKTRSLDGIIFQYYTKLKKNVPMFKIRGTTETSNTKIIVKEKNIKYTPKLNIILELSSKLSTEDRKHLVLELFGQM